jgi:hypothetical protein
MPKRLKDESPALTFEQQLSAHMAKLGAKGGKVSGARRMRMPPEQRSEIALKAALARWGNKPKS